MLLRKKGLCVSKFVCMYAKRASANKNAGKRAHAQKPGVLQNKKGLYLSMFVCKGLAAPIHTYTHTLLT